MRRSGRPPSKKLQQGEHTYLPLHVSVWKGCSRGHGGEDPTRVLNRVKRRSWRGGGVTKGLDEEAGQSILDGELSNLLTASEDVDLL